MTYVCKIFKSTEHHIAFVYGINGLELPLFELQCNPIPTSVIGYTVYFYKEDRYTPSLIGVNPPKELTDEQRNIINQAWNHCVETGAETYEFEL